MLRRLEISNFAVISHCVFEPGSGLNVISGETGAGKSLLIDAIGLILGDKASKTLIRSDCDKAYVEALFDPSALSEDSFSELKVILENYGLPFDEENLIISREINADGKSSARINGRSAVLTVLKEISSIFVDIHGQNDTQKIFDENTHCDLLDRFIGKEAYDLKKQYTDVLQQYKNTVLKIRDLGSSPEANAKRREYLMFASSEIRKADFKEGEEEELSELKKRFENSARISNLLEEANELLYASEDSSVTTLKQASGIIEKLSVFDESYKEISEKLNSLSLDVEALASDVNSKFEADEYSEEKLDETDKRISLLYDMKSKYGSSISEINKFADDAEKEISDIDNSEIRLGELRKELKIIESDLLSKSKALSELRHKHAEVLSSKIVNELSDLEMVNTRFGVNFKEHSKQKYFSGKGTEDISFEFSANPGESLKPLSRIASGGEASRIMLAVKTILSEADSTPTLIFDEIDTGISGAAALKVAEKLKAISLKHQVLSVTHTAQIASAADVNFYICKHTDLVSSNTEIIKLDQDGKIKEVSRLLSGTSDEESFNLAKNLIARF